MAAQIKIFLHDSEEFQDLREWMGGHAGIVVEAVPRAATPNAQGSGWDFLSLLFAEGGAVVAGMKALQVWMASRVTVVEIETDKVKIKVTSSNASTALSQIAEITTKLLDSGEAQRGEDT